MLVFLDKETYYDIKTYTLKNMSIEAYVRDPRYEVQLLGVAIDDGPVYMYPSWLVGDVLKALPLEHPDTYTFVHNARFDIFSAAERYGKYVHNPICVRAMARWTGISRLVRESQESICKFLGTGEKGRFLESMSGRYAKDLSAEELADYMAYCTSDVRDMRRNVMAMLPHMTQDALDFIAMTTKMYTVPRFVIDVPLLEDYYQKLSDAHAKSQETLQHLFRFSTQEEFLKALRSKKKFCEMLESIGGVVPYKVSPKKTETARKKLEQELTALQTLLQSILAMKENGHYVEDGWFEQELQTLASIDRVQEQLDNETYVKLEPALAKKDLEFMALMESDDPNIAALATARAENNSSIAMSRTKTFLEIGKRGLLPVPLEPFLAWTGRYTAGGSAEDVKSDGVNLQNLAKRGGDKTLRHAITATSGNVVVAGDSSQIEARVLAWMAGQQDLLNEFATGGDPYSTFGANAYNEDPATVYYWTKGKGNELQGDEYKDTIKWYELIRFIGKTGILQLGYGSGGPKLALFLSQNKVRLEYKVQADMEYTDSNGEPCIAKAGTVIKGTTGHLLECQRIVDAYRATYGFIPQFWRTCNSVIEQMYLGGYGYFGGPNHRALYWTSEHDVFGHKMPGIMLPDGYWLRYPNLRQEFDEAQNRKVWVYDQMNKGRIQRKTIYGGLLTNNICQSFAFAIMRYQALNINKVIPVALNVHDEWVSVAPEIAETATKEFYTQEMRRVPEWAAGVPLDCEVHSGRTYGQI